MKKVSLLLVVALLGFVFILASCSQVFTGDDILGKAIKLTLTSKSYEIEYEGKTYKGDAEKASLGGIDTYIFTSGGTGSCVVADKKVTAFNYTSTDLSVMIISLTGLSRSLEDGEVYIDYIELIIEE